MDHAKATGDVKDFTKGGGSVIFLGNTDYTMPVFTVCGAQLGAQGVTSSSEYIFRKIETNKGEWEPRWKIACHCDDKNWDNVQC